MKKAFRFGVVTGGWYEDNNHITEVTNPRVIETRYRSPQSTLWAPGPDEWLLFKMLSGYAVRKKQKQGDVIQLPWPELDTQTEAM